MAPQAAVMGGNSAERGVAAGGASPLPNPRRLLLISLLAIALLVASVCASVAYAIHFVDQAAIAGERERAIAALRTVGERGAERGTAPRISRDFVLDGARYTVPAQVRASEIAIPVPGTADLVLAWEPRRLGSKMAAVLAPLRLLVSGFFLGAVSLLLYQLFRVATELEKRRRAAQLLASRDPLTGLGSRHAFDQGLERMFQQQGSNIALLYLDLDDFKRVNDSLGHAAGDELLRELGARLSGLAREGDLVARIGGDEFGFLRTSGASRAELAELAADIAMTIARPLRIGATELAVGTSIGIAVAPEHAAKPFDLVRAADRALYRVKSVHGGCFLFAEATPGEASDAA